MGNSGAAFVFSVRGEQRAQVGSEKLDGNRQENNPEEFAQDIDSAGPQHLLEDIDFPDHQIDHHHVEEESYQDIAQGILGPEREERREGTGPGDKGKNNRDNRIHSLRALQLKEAHVEGHLHRHHEYHQRTRHRKGGNIDPEEPQKLITQKKKYQKNGQGIERGPPRGNLHTLIALINNDRGEPRHVDHGEKYHKSAQHLLPIQSDHRFLSFSFTIRIPPQTARGVTPGGYST